MPDQEPLLRLDAPREEVLDQATSIVRAAWKSFDQARPGQPGLDDVVRRLLDSPLPEEPTAASAALRDTARVLDESIAPARPRYFAFVGSSGLEIGVVADALAACFDVNLAAYGGAATAIEREVLRWVADFVGFPGIAGAVTSGGTVSNITALAAAREHAVPGARRRGLRDVLPRVYCSVDAHDSVERAIEVLGIGSDGMVTVPVDGQRRLDVAELERALDADRSDGATPIAVIANGGSTLAGAVDPLDAIADVCQRHGVWLHVDGAYGLPAAATPSAGELFRGLERADSVTVDAHKWLYLPKACGVVLVRDEQALAAAFAHDAEYMLRTGEQWNPVDLTLEYSRPFRPLKLWLAFRVHGAAAFRAAIERNLAQARLLAEEVRRHPDLELLVEPQLSVVPFRHVPPGVRDLDAHNRLLADTIQAEADIYLAAATYDGTVGLRPCIVNYRTTDDDVRAIVEIAREVGARLAGGNRRGGDGVSSRMIALLLIILAGFAAVFGVSSVDPGGGDPEPQITVVGPVTTSEAELVHLEAQRTGGVAYQELSASIDDPTVLEGLQALVPLPVPPATGPSGACSDCWIYHVVLQYAGEQGSIVLDYDQANEPPELAAFFDALDPYLEGGADDPPADTRLEDVPPQGSLDRIEVERSGGFDGQTLNVTIDDPSELGVIASLAPYPLPATDGPTSGCADCWVYHITVHYRGVEEPVVLEFDQSNAPSELEPFLGLLDSRLEAERAAG